MAKLFTTSGQYGVKRSGKYGKLSPAERAELNIQKGLYDNPETVTKQMQKDLDALLKETQKTVNAKIDALQKYADETGRESPSLIPKIEFPKDTQEKIKEIARGKIFDAEETSTVEGTAEFFDNVGDDIDNIFDDIEDNDEWEKLLENLARENDRWTIMRRIIQLHPEYTQSEILDMIDEIMSYGFNLTTDDITNMILEYIGDSDKKASDFENKAKQFR